MKTYRNGIAYPIKANRPWSNYGPGPTEEVVLMERAKMLEDDIKAGWTWKREELEKINKRLHNLRTIP